MILIACGMKTEAAILNDPQGAVVVQGRDADASLSADLQAAVQALLVGQAGVVTARQFRNALVAAGSYAAAKTAIDALTVTSAANIDWYSCAFVHVGSAVMQALITPLGITDGGTALITAAAAYPA